MKILIILKYKLVIVVENYEEVDGKNVYYFDVKGFLFGFV